MCGRDVGERAKERPGSYGRKWGVGKEFERVARKRREGRESLKNTRENAKERTTTGRMIKGSVKRDFEQAHD